MPEDTAIVTHSQNKARKKRAPSGSNERAPDISKATDRQGGGEPALLSRKGILVSVLLAAALVLAGGLSYQLWIDGKQRRDVPGRSSRHVRRQRNLRRLPSGAGRVVARLATQARDGSRDREVGPRRFLRCDLRLLRCALALLPQGRQISGRDRRTRRQARHVRGQVHVWPRSASAIPDRISRRPTAGPVDRLGQPTESKRAASAGSTSIPTRRSVTTTSCTGPS